MNVRDLEATLSGAAEMDCMEESALVAADRTLGRGRLPTGPQFPPLQ